MRKAPKEKLPAAGEPDKNDRLITERFASLLAEDLQPQ
jgi:hypothetical protein